MSDKGKPIALSWAEAEGHVRIASADPVDVPDWAVVIEKSPEVLLTISKVLKSFCLSVHPFQSASAALKFLSKCSNDEVGKIRAVFSSFELSGSTGIKFVDTFKQDPRLKQIPIIVSSNKDEPSIRNLLGRQLLQGHLIKPLSTEVIANKIMELNVLGSCTTNDSD